MTEGRLKGTWFFARRVAAGLIGGAAAIAGGCSGGGNADLSTYSSVRGESSGVLAPEFSVHVYFPGDQNTADIYLSDIPLSELADPKVDLTSRTGNLVHIHVFLIPSAGMTPIENKACNVSVRHLVLAGRAGSAPGMDAIGLYGGGGFMLTGSDPGDDPFSGTIRDASVRLTRATPAFTDRLGSATMSGTFSAVRDDGAARSIAARFEQISRGLSVR